MDIGKIAPAARKRVQPREGHRVVVALLLAAALAAVSAATHQTPRTAEPAGHTMQIAGGPGGGSGNGGG